MSSKKGSIAYENRLARRRMNRKIARLEKEISSGTLDRQMQAQRRAEIFEIQKLKSETYFRTKTGERRSVEVTVEAVESYERGRWRETAQSIAARNRQAASEITSTYFVEPLTKEHIQNPASGYTEAEMRTFFRVTQRAWENAPADKRVEAIMDAYNIYDLRELIRIVLDRHQDDIKKWAQELKQKNTAQTTEDVVQDDVAQEFASTDVLVDTRNEVEEVYDEYVKVNGVS